MSVFLLFGVVNKTHAAPDIKSVQILATSDIHNRFVAYDYATNSEISSGGLTRLSTKIDELRESNPNTILIDNGDTIQGNMSMLFLNDELLPMVEAMNAMDYDVFTAGNHEFNYGMDIFKKVRDTFEGAFLCSNVYEGDAESLKRVTKNYEIIETDGVKVAVIGAVTPHITKWDKSNMEGYTVTNPYLEIEQAIEEITENELADVIIVSFHASLEGEFGEDSTLFVANNFPEVDAVITGHAHAKFVERGSFGAVIIEPASFGSQLSQININVTYNSDTGRYYVKDRINDINAQNIAIDKTVSENSELFDLLNDYHIRALSDASMTIGNLEGANLIADNEIAGIPQAQIADSAFIDLILKVQLLEAKKALLNEDTGLKHVSGAALFNTNTNVLEGPITKSDVSKIYQFDNTLTVLKINGSQLKAYMEWSASYYNTFNDGDLTISFNQDIRAYNYDMFMGVDYNIDISQDAGSRIVNLVYSDDKQPVLDTDLIYLTVNNYRANGLRAELDEFSNAQIIYESTGNKVEAIRDMITNYIIEQGIILPEMDNNWSLIGIDYDPNLHNIAKTLVNDGQLVLPSSLDGRTPNVRSLVLEDINEVTKSVDLLSINDFHGAILESQKNIGASKLVAYLKQAKSINPNTLVLSAGDHYQGSAISNLTRGDVVSDIFKEVGLSYSAIGNHEFDWGIEYLSKWQKDGQYQFLAANIVYSDTLKTVDFAVPYAIEEFEGKKIGIIGIATPDTKFSTLPQNVDGLTFLDPKQTVEIYVKELKEQGVEAIYVLSHLGSTQDGDLVTGEATDLLTNDQTIFSISQTDIDGIITGHTHKYVSGYVNGVPIVQAGYNGRAVAKIHSVYDLNDNYLGSWQELDELYMRVNELSTDQNTDDIIARYLELLNPIISEVIGTTDEFNHDTSLDTQVTSMGFQISKMMREIGQTDFAIINGGGIRKGFEQGNITVGSMYEIFPFDNTLVTVNVTGAHLKELILHGIMPDGFKPGQFYGLTVYYTINDNGDVIIESMYNLNGELILDHETYSITILDFMLSGGDLYDFSGAKNVVNTQIPLRDALINYIKDYGHLKNEYQNPMIYGQGPTGDENENNINVNDLPKTGQYFDCSITIYGFATLLLILFLNLRKKIF